MKISQRMALAVALLAAPAVFADGILVRCTRPCDAAKAAVVNAGGTVTAEFQYVDAIAAELPRSGVAKVGAALPAGSVRKDMPVSLPAVVERNGRPAELETAVDDATPLSVEQLQAAAEANPAGYSINNTYLNIASLHAAGKTGANVRVAVIDAGLRPSYIVTFGSVLGGEDFVGDGRTYINSANATHGTFVGGMIANNVLWNLGTGHAWYKAIKYECPSCSPAAGQVTMTGSAPGAKLYALRVFGPTGGAPESRIIAAMDRVIALRAAYDATGVESIDANGKASALNIKVCNMSLGGSTFYAGKDIEDQVTQQFLDHDIVLVTSAGNDGPSGTTGGSPGTGYAALTVGAAQTAVHERILRDLQYGLGIGPLFRPYANTIMASFSSRGPTADGRPDPEVVANGYASFSSNGIGSLSISSGTSFSSPTVAGVAAVLRQAYPGATARQIRNAIVLGADPTAIAGASVNDQGYGFVNAAASAALLAGGAVPDTNGAQGVANKNVQVNLVQNGGGVDIASGNVTRSATLLPGQRLEVYYDVKKNTSKVLISLAPIQTGATQNVFFGDDAIVTVHSAKTSAIGASGDYKIYEYSTGGSWAVENPETGLMRITINGDSTNASAIGATVNIASVSDSVPGNTSTQKIVEGDYVLVPFTVPAGAAKLDARLEWANNWGAYPTDDLDLILVPPTGSPNYDAATINSPETASIATPAAGQWTAIVQGYSIPQGDERYTLTLTIDGKAVTLKK